MKLNGCEKNKPCKVVSVVCEDQNLKLRLYEIGFFPLSQIKVLHKVFSKKTMLVQVLDSCFALKSKVAEMIEVEYV